MLAHRVRARSTPSRRARTIVAIAVGAAAGAFAVWVQWSNRSNFSDFDNVWLAARALLGGQDAYEYVPKHWVAALFYPLTTAVVAVPFALLPRVLAAGAWSAVGFGILAYGATRTAWWPLIGLASYPALDAASLAQSSPLATAIAFLPGLAWLSLVKPTTAGAVALSHFPRTLTRRNVALGTSLIIVSLALDPHWPAQWRVALRASPHFSLISKMYGLPLLLALARWRRPEARLVALLAIVPQLARAHDALPLIMIVPSNRREAFLLSSLSLAMAPFLVVRGVLTYPSAAWSNGIAQTALVISLLLYLPALLMVLRRPNSGELPAWLERATQRLPQWARGVPATASAAGCRSKSA